MFHLSTVVQYIFPWSSIYLGKKETKLRKCENYGILTRCYLAKNIRQHKRGKAETLGRVHRHLKGEEHRSLNFEVEKAIDFVELVSLNSDSGFHR